MTLARPWPQQVATAMSARPSRPKFGLWVRQIESPYRDLPRQLHQAKAESDIGFRLAAHTNAFPHAINFGSQILPAAQRRSRDYLQ
jgi:hypothetical protein